MMFTLLTIASAVVADPIQNFLIIDTITCWGVTRVVGTFNSNSEDVGFIFAPMADCLAIRANQSLLSFHNLGKPGKTKTIDITMTNYQFLQTWCAMFHAPVWTGSLLIDYNFTMETELWTFIIISIVFTLIVVIGMIICIIYYRNRRNGIQDSIV